MNFLTNTLNSTLTNTHSMLNTLGRAALHALYPDEIEYYFCSLELLDSAGKTKGYMTFVIMPDNIMDTRTQIATITKTKSGVSTLFNSSFSPRDLSIQGSFGRKMRLVTGVYPDGNLSTIPFFAGNTGVSLNGENLLIKTGYGLSKMLEKMVDSAWVLDDKQKPHILIFNNYARNTSYVVEPLQRSFSQDLSNNMIWSYSVEFKAVADGKMVKSNFSGQKSMKKGLTTVANAAIAKGLTGLITDYYYNIGKAIRL